MVSLGRTSVGEGKGEGKREGKREGEGKEGREGEELGRTGEREKE